MNAVIYKANIIRESMGLNKYVLINIARERTEKINRISCSVFPASTIVLMINGPQGRQGSIDKNNIIFNVPF